MWLGLVSILVALVITAFFYRPQALPTHQREVYERCATCDRPVGELKPMFEDRRRNRDNYGPYGGGYLAP
jgi:hypothetical protein